MTLQGFELPVGLVLDADSRNEHGLAPAQIDGLLTVNTPAVWSRCQGAVVGPAPEPALYPQLHRFLYDAAPEDAHEVALEPAVGKAWTYQDHLYVRTERLLRWPAWTAQAKAPGGIAIYELPIVPLLMLAAEGETLNVSVANASDMPAAAEVTHVPKP